MNALGEAHARAVPKRVEIGCGYGMRRTGTALSLLAVVSGVEPDDAVAWVHENYHPHAVETRQDRWWVREASARLLMCARELRARPHRMTRTQPLCHQTR